MTHLCASKMHSTMTHLCASKMHCAFSKHTDASVRRGCAHSIAFFPLRAKFLFVVALFLSAAPFSAVVPDATGVELFFVARTASGSAQVRSPAVPKCALLRGTATVPYGLLPWHHCHRPSRLALLKNIKKNILFFWSLRNWSLTGILVREVHRVLGQGDTRFLFCWGLGPVNRRENWKTWERRGENLDNQDFHGLIINPFDNQTVSLKFPTLIITNQWYFRKQAWKAWFW